MRDIIFGSFLHKMSHILLKINSKASEEGCRISGSDCGTFEQGDRFLTLHYNNKLHSLSLLKEFLIRKSCDNIFNKALRK